jgi:hypothetical protein
MKWLSEPGRNALAVAMLAAGALSVVACDPPSAPAQKKAPTAPANPDDSANGGDPAAPKEEEPKDDPPAPFTPPPPVASGPAAPAGPLPPLTPRCATRLSIALSGKSPSAALLAGTDMAATIDSLIGSADFAERYARFINSEFNDSPATSASADPVYYLAKHVITNDKPWSDLFIGAYQVKATTDGMTVSNDAGGLGYFRTDAWRKRYAGNEPKGVMLVGAFRILENTTGLQLTASVGNPGDDRTETGRMAAACKGCHFDSWFALDKVARLLPTKSGQDDTVSFTPPTAGAQQLFGKSIADDHALLAALVDSDGWRFQQCREVFKFMYGRPENKCEAQTFDRCVDALVQQKTLRAAVAAVAKDPAVCK